MPKIAARMSSTTPAARAPAAMSARPRSGGRPRGPAAGADAAADEVGAGWPPAGGSNTGGSAHRSGVVVAPGDSPRGVVARGEGDASGEETGETGCVAGAMGRPAVGRATVGRGTVGTTCASRAPPSVPLAACAVAIAGGTRTCPWSCHHRFLRGEGG